MVGELCGPGCGGEPAVGFSDVSPRAPLSPAPADAGKGVPPPLSGDRLPQKRWLVLCGFWLVCGVSQCRWPKSGAAGGRTAACRLRDALPGAVRADGSPTGFHASACRWCVFGVVAPPTACGRLPLGEGLAGAEALGFTPSIFSVVFC